MSALTRIKPGKAGNFRWVHRRQKASGEAITSVSDVRGWATADEAIADAKEVLKDPGDVVVRSTVDGADERVDPWGSPAAIREAVAAQAVEVNSQAVHEALSESRGDKLDLICLDSRYRALPKSLWQRIVAAGQVDLRTYKPEFFDCDDFAIVFAGRVRDNYEVNSCGQVIDWSGAHAYNVLISVDDAERLRPLWLEPQTDALMDALPQSGQYAGKNGIIIL